MAHLSQMILKPQSKPYLKWPSPLMIRPSHMLRRLTRSCPYRPSLRQPGPRQKCRFRKRRNLRQTSLLVCYPSPRITVDSDDDGSRSLKLQRVVAEFEVNYTSFASRNQFLVSVEPEVHKALQTAAKQNNFKHSVDIFKREIAATLQAKREHQAVSQTKWRQRLTDFMVKLYPILRLSLGLTSAVADVTLGDDSH
jgi:hypothetical protein